MERAEPDQRRKHDQRREHFAIGFLHLDGGRVAKALGKGLDEYFGNENKELETTADLILLLDYILSLSPQVLLRLH